MFLGQEYIFEQAKLVHKKEAVRDYVNWLGDFDTKVGVSRIESKSFAQELLRHYIFP